MICKRFSDFSLEEQNMIVTCLMKKNNNLINNLVENKLNDIKLLNENNLADIAYTTSKYYLIDVLNIAKWALFDEEYNMFVFETSCKGE